MNLFDEIARALGMRKADQGLELEGIRTSFTETESRLNDFEARLIRVENAVTNSSQPFKRN